MKNKLLMTTALTAIFLSANVYAESGKLEITEGIHTNPTENGRADTGHDDDNILQRYEYDSVTMSGGELTLKDMKITSSGNVEISGGKITTTGPDEDHHGGLQANSQNGELKISGDTTVIDSTTSALRGHKTTIEGGTITLKNMSEMSGFHELQLSDGTINLSGRSGLGVAGHDDDKTENLESATFTMSGGTINMDNATLFALGTSEKGKEDDTNVKVSFTGGEINANSGKNVFLMDIEKTEIGNTINVKQGASLGVYKNEESAQNETIQEEYANKSGLKLTENGVINLSGTLVSNIEGNGALNINSSSAVVDGNVTGTKLSFNANHTLGKAITGEIGKLDALNVNKGVSLDIGTNTVEAGSANFADNSTLNLRVSEDKYGNIVADTITIGDDTTLNVTLDNGVVENGAEKDFNFLSGNVTGSFENKIAENSRYDIQWNEDGTLHILGTATASDIVEDAGGTSNNVNTAEAWDSLTASSSASEKAKEVASALSTLSQNATTPEGQNAYIDALTAVAPEVAPMVEQTQSEVTNQVFNAVSTRLTGGSVSSGSQGMSPGDSVFERAAAWVQGLYNKAKLDDTSKSKGFDSDTKGVAFGLEKYLTEDVKAGIGYAYSQTDIDGFMRDTDVDTHTAILYGEYKPSNWYVNGIATYGWSDYEEKKNVGGVNVKADYDVETLGLQLMTGYEMKLKALNVTPEAGLRYVHVDQDSYKDGADQHVSGHTSDIITGVIGAKVSKDIALNNGLNLKPEARLAATYDLETDKSNAVVTLANGSAYKVNGEGLDRFGVELGAGLTAELNDKVEVSLGYEGKFREDYQDHSGILSAKYKF